MHIYMYMHTMDFMMTLLPCALRQAIFRPSGANIINVALIPS